MANPFVTQHEIYSTYTKLGYTKKQIDDDIIFTLQNRLYNMTTREKKELGITDEDRKGGKGIIL